MILNLLLSNWYELSLTAFFLVVYLYTTFSLRRTESRRLRNLEDLKFGEAVETDSPVPDQVAELKEKGAESIEGRFSFLSRAVPVLTFGTWGTLMLLPYLGKLPAAYITLTGAVLSVVIAVAFRPFLENLFAGVVVAYFRSIRIGDMVTIDGQYGLIEEIGLTYTVLKRWDWNRIVIPNAKLLQKEIQNMTMTDSYIWAYVEFFVEPGADLKRVRELATTAAKQSKYFNPSEEPAFWVMGLERDAIRCWLAAWADGPNEAWGLRNDMNTKLLIALNKEGIHLHRFNFATEQLAERVRPGGPPPGVPA